MSAGEDSEICLALVQRGWKLWYDNSLKLKHFIPSARLNINYLKGMYKGFGKAEVILAIYRSLINSKGTNTASWIFQCITSVKLLWHSGLKTIFSSRKDRIRNKIFWIHDRAYTWELINSRTKYSRVRKLVSSAGYLPKNGEMRV